MSDSEQQLEVLKTIKHKLRNNPNSREKYIKKLIKNVNDFNVEAVAASGIGKEIKKLSIEGDKLIAGLASQYMVLVKGKVKKETEENKKEENSYESKERVKPNKVKTEKIIKSEAGSEIHIKKENPSEPKKYDRKNLKIKNKSAKHKLKEEASTSSPKKKIKLESDVETKKNSSPSVKKTKKKKKSKFKSEPSFDMFNTASNKVPEVPEVEADVDSSHSENSNGNDILAALSQEINSQDEYDPAGYDPSGNDPKAYDPTAHSSENPLEYNQGYVPEMKLENHTEYNSENGESFPEFQDDDAEVNDCRSKATKPQMYAGTQVKRKLHVGLQLFSKRIFLKVYDFISLT